MLRNGNAFLRLLLLLFVFMAMSFRHFPDRRLSYQWKVAAELNKRGFFVLYDWQWDVATNSSREYSQDGTGVRAPRLGNVIIVSGPQLTDEDLRLIAKFPKVIQIEGGPTYQVSDKGLHYLTQLKSLRLLPPLRGRTISDVGVKYLANVGSLTDLSLAGSFTDQGLHYLSEMENLECLELFSLQMTDAGVKSFARSLKLKSLYLHGGSVSKAALDHLKNVKPFLQVTYWPE